MNVRKWQSTKRTCKLVLVEAHRYKLVDRVKSTDKLNRGYVKLTVTEGAGLSSGLGGTHIPKIEQSLDYHIQPTDPSSDLF